MAESWVSIDAVAAHLGVRKDSIYRWIDGRGLPARKIGKLWKLKLSEVDSWVQAQGVSRPAAEESSPHPSKRVRPEKGVVLVIDDDQSLRETLRDFLEEEGYGVLLAADGEEGLTLLRSASARPTLVILDLGMPRVDGWRFREQQLRDRDFATIPVVVVTAIPRANLQGACVLRKPFTLRQLAETIATLGRSLPNVEASTS